VECDPALSEKEIRLASCSIVCGLLSRRPHGVENTLYRKHIKSKVSTSALFFSWQSDTPPRVSRNIIEQALKLALEKISLDLEIEEAARSLELDRDTRGVGGSPPIVDTIFKKISAAAIFVADMTFVAKRRDGRPAPNPNVLIEYGWALRASRSWPNNLCHEYPLRRAGGLSAFRYEAPNWPLKFRCAEEATSAERKRQFRS
jgi:hypothetical protein